MKISQKLEYACRALAQLAKAYDKISITPLEEIARREAIPRNFLVQIFNDLRKAGLIESRRGKSGGYCLARPPEEMTLREVVEAVEPQILKRRASTDGESGSTVQHTWHGIGIQLQQALNQISVSRFSLPTWVPMYHI